MKNVKQVLNNAIEEIKPGKDYEKNIFSILSSIIKKINQKKGIEAILGGSGAKGTWLKTFDADIFVLFDYKKFKDKSDKLPDILERTLKKKFRGIARIHGSRDYFQIKQGNFTFEIVPIIKIQKAEQAKNITDVSPLHSKWVGKYKKLADEMKLAKQFCQAQNVYGAESYIRGFSGYVCEILTAYYGSFLNLIKNAVKWNAKVVVDVERYYKGKDVFKLVNTSKLASPLIVIDPVQKDRNAAAALSVEKFESFKKAAGEFLKAPSKEFFMKRNLNDIFLLKKSNKKLIKIIKIRVTPLFGKADVVGSKLLKIYEFLKIKFEEHGFKILKKEWEWDKRSDALLFFLFENKPLPKNMEMEGPPIKIRLHAENFRKMHKKTFVRRGRIFALRERKFLVPEELLKELIKNEFVKERCRAIKICAT